MMKLFAPNCSTARDRRRAFSLIEIMVAVALLAFIIVGLLAMFYQVQRAFRAGTAQVDVMEGGRATISLLTRDLQTVEATGFLYVTNWVVVPSQGVTPTIQELASGAVRDNYLQDLCFMTRVNDEWIGTAYRISNSVSGVGTLYRLVQTTNSATLPQENSNHVSGLSYLVCRSSPYDFPGLNYHRLLDGVVSFTVFPVDTNGFSYPPNSVLHPDVNNASDLRIDRTRNAEVYAFMADKRPAYVDIELAVLEPSAFEKFKARAELDPPNTIPVRATNYLAKQIGRTHIFRQRIPIRAATVEPGASP